MTEPRELQAAREHGMVTNGERRGNRDGSVPRGTRAKILSQATSSCGGQGFRVSPVLFELALPPYRIADCIISGTHASTPRIATVVPENSGRGDADDGERRAVDGERLPDRVGAPPRLRCQ